MTIPEIISVDDHVVEPAHVWSARLPTRYRDRGPRVEELPAGEIVLDGGGYIEKPGTEGRLFSWWHYEDNYYSVKRPIAAAGYDADEIRMEAVTFDDMRRGCWDPAARVADMDINHVEASLCFPNYPRFCGQIFLNASDRALALLCVKAYNDWMVDEWCGDSNGRLVPLCLVPLWDVDLAAQEVRRNAARGVRAVAFSELPTWLGLPSLHSGYWDRFFAACEETGTVVCMHIGSGTRTVSTADDAPDAVSAALIFANSAAGMIDMLYSGVLVKFPELSLLYAECQTGWIPYVLERIDDVWETHRGWAATHDTAPEPPSTYYYRQVHACFFKDQVGVDLLEKVGVDNVMFETDYPHQDGTWPQSRAVAEKLFGHLDQPVVDKLARGNAARLFGLDLPDDRTSPQSSL